MVVHIKSRDGTTIGFRKLGQGPGLVVVHSSIATGDEWSRMASALADRFTVHLVDRRDRGVPHRRPLTPSVTEHSRRRRRSSPR
ncbi:hypothetical protein A5767_12755 [Rhodococcus sp. 852002-51564_SCH6189132-a]|nr:hypothetical protein A5767_12755 [Rhodococcus sp. 852002-51564_SCH6189132-a]